MGSLSLGDEQILCLDHEGRASRIGYKSYM